MSDRQVVLTRNIFLPYATLGDLITDSGYSFKSVERPWLDNQPDVSCDPIGSYRCGSSFSPKHGCNVYHLLDVRGRTAVEIHAANLAIQLLGCIALGKAIAEFKASSISENLPPADMMGVTESVTAIAEFEAAMRNKDGIQELFVLVIKNS